MQKENNTVLEKKTRMLEKRNSAVKLNRVQGEKNSAVKINYGMQARKNRVLEKN